MIRASVSVKLLMMPTALEISDSIILFDNTHLELLPAVLMMVPLRRHVMKGEGRASTVQLNVTLSPKLLLMVVGVASLIIGITIG